MRNLLSAEELDEALRSTVPAWRVEDGTLVRSIKARSFADAIRLVDQVAAFADEIDHHPDIDIRWTTVTCRLTTHSAGGLTEMDVQLAEAIDRLASAEQKGDPRSSLACLRSSSGTRCRESSTKRP